MAADMTESTRIQPIAQKLFDKMDPRHGSLLPYQKLVLPDKAFVFFFLGGNGITLGLDLYQMLHRSVDPEEIRKKVRFLFYDCHKENLNTLVRSGQIQADEQEFVPCDGVFAALQSDPYLRAWAGQDFLFSIHAEDFNDGGAGAKRKVSSVRFLSSASIHAFRKRLADALSPLSAYPLSVYVVFGTGGGTGSGLVIPLTMAAHTFIQQDALHPMGTVSFTGIALSPSTINDLPPERCDPTSANRTALLKELDWLNRCCDTGETVTIPISASCTISNRNEHGKPSKLFDGMILVEGVSDGTVLDRPAQALEIMANHIFHEMTDQSGLMQAAFFNNAASASTALLLSKSDEVLPRNVTYLNNIVGNATYYLPYNELCGYMGYKVYKPVLDKYTNACLVSDARIQSALESLELQDTALVRRIRQRSGFWGGTSRQMRYASNSSKIVQTAQTAIDRMCSQALEPKGEGVAFLVNFSRGLAEALKGQAEEFSSLIPGAKGDDQLVYKYAASICVKVSEHLVTHCHNAFKLTEAMLRSFSKVLEKYANICTDVKVFDNHLSQTLSWSNACLAKTGTDSPVLLSLIEEVLDRGRIHDLTQKFTDFLSKHVQQWATLLSEDPNADPTRDFQDFMQENFVDLLNGSFEELVVKLFANDLSAKVVTRDEQGNLVVTPQVQTAAQQIYQTCVQKGAYLAKLRAGAGGQISEYNKSLVLLVPESCGHLMDALKAAVPHGVQVLPFQENNKICLTTFYSGLPLFKFESMEPSQRAYHQLSGLCGMHLLEGRGWPNGYELPNPIPANLHSALNLDQDSAFTVETTVSSQVRRDLAQARSPRLDIARLRYDTVGVKQVYHSCLLQLLPGQDGLIRPDVSASAQSLFDQLALGEDEALEDVSLRQLLKDHGLVLEEADTFYPNMVTSTLNPTAAWDWEITAQAVRCRVPLMHRLTDTVAVLTRLDTLVQEHIDAVKSRRQAEEEARQAEETARLAQAEAERRVLDSRRRFAKLWMSGVLTCEDDGDQCWIFRLDHDVPLFETDPMDNVQLRFPHYFAWKALLDLADEDLATQADAALAQADSSVIRQRKPLLHEALQALVSDRSGDLALASSRFSKAMALNGHEAEADDLKEFYGQLNQII